jgi:signal transduction histidine kinase/CheY-like chemotaxis protein
MRIVRADDEVRDLEVAAAFIDFAGRPCSLVSVFDITERKRQEQEEAETQARLLQTQKLESLGVLAGGIAHDFNNLLVGILGNADLALAELSPESTARDTVRDIQVTAQRAAELTRQMLAYSGKGRFVVEPIDISRLVEEMAHLLEVTAARRATLRLRAQPNLPLVQADATQLRQVVMNLIMNASEAIGDRSGVISVSTGITYIDADYAGTTEYTGPLTEGEYVHIEVADTGAGMDEATTTRIFEPFFTTKFTGRGLGLAAVLGIVRGHNGAIKVYSEVGRGTTFKVLLPASRSSPISGAPEQPASTGAWRGAGRALLVDDDETVRRVTARMLARAGFETLEATDGDGAIALALADEATITVVILDLTMPGLSGKDTFLALHRLLPGVPIVLTSGYNEQEATDDFAGRGLAGFLQKPFRYDDLAAMLRAVERG